MTKLSEARPPHFGLTESAAPATPAAGEFEIYAATDGTLHSVNDAGTDTNHSAGSGLAAAHTTRTSGSLTLNSTSWADLDTGMDLTLAAVENDIIQVSLAGLWGTETGSSGILDVATIVSASPVNYIGSSGGAGDFGVGAWFGDKDKTSAESLPIGGSVLYTIAAGDLSGGNVTLRLRYRTDIASNKTLFAIATIPLLFGAVNFGQ